MAGGELKQGEFHPPQAAASWIRAQGVASLIMWQEAFASCAIRQPRR